MTSLSAIVDFIQPVKFVGNKNLQIEKIAELRNYENNPAHLSWCNDKNLNTLAQYDCGTFICSEKILESPLKQNVNYIIVKSPRVVFQSILVKFFYAPPAMGKIETTSSIHSTSKIGKNAYIGHNVVIEENCLVGDNCYIGHNTVVLKQTVIENNVTIGSNNTIGGVGFGYEKNNEGDYTLMPHIGNVVIKKNVEIGNNTCIDRGVIGSTVINENVKIDNLVHIAHGVVIGKNSLIIANSMIAGSTVIGENVWVAPSVSLLNKIEIGDDAFVGMGAVVLKSVDSKTLVVGNPSKKIKDL